MNPDRMEELAKAHKAVHDLVVAGYGPELNAIIGFLVQRPLHNLAQLCELTDTEVAANPDLPEEE